MVIRLFVLFAFLLFTSSIFAQNIICNEIETSNITDKEGLKQGKWSGKYSNSLIIYKGNYKNGKRDGDWTWYTSNGELWMKATYMDGHPAFIINYLEDATDFDAYSKPNGTDAAIDLPVKNKKWLRHNLLFDDTLFNPDKDYFTLKEIYLTGKGKRLIVEYLYDSEPGINELINQRPGAWKHSTKKLNLLSAVIYKNEIPWKTIALFNKRSKPLETGNLNEGTGTWTAYYPSGKIYVTGQLENGMKTGTWCYFDEDGKPTITANYENDKKSGTYTDYYTSGNKKHEFTYKNDTIKGEYKSYHSNGNLRTSGNIKIAKEGFDVEGSTFSGLLFQEKNYTVFKGTGMWKFYHNNGEFKNQYLYNNESLWESSFYKEDEETTISKD